MDKITTAIGLSQDMSDEVERIVKYGVLISSALVGVALFLNFLRGLFAPVTVSVFDAVVASGVVLSVVVGLSLVYYWKNRYKFSNVFFVHIPQFLIIVTSVLVVGLPIAVFVGISVFYSVVLSLLVVVALLLSAVSTVVYQVRSDDYYHDGRKCHLDEDCPELGERYDPITGDAPRFMDSCPVCVEE